MIKREKALLDIPPAKRWEPATDHYATKRQESLEWMRQFGNRKPLQDEEKDNG